MSLVDLTRPLSSEIEIRSTELYSVISLKSSPAFKDFKLTPDIHKAEKVVKEAEAAEDVLEEDDLFAEDEGDEEAAKLLQERLGKEARERAAKKMKNARSLIVLEVKPYEADFDLQTLAEGIKKFEHEGIQNWGEQHKLEPVAYGIKKLVISVVVYDELIGVDDIVDMITENFGDDVQSVDVQAMSKV